MKRISLMTLLMLIVSIVGKAQTSSEFNASGKPFMKIHSNYHTTFSDGESASAFELTRMYLGYEYNFSENFSAKANIDIADPKVGDLQMTAFVKNAYINYETSKLSVNFGMIATTQFKVQEKAWGYRYIEKSFQDTYKFNSSADLGISLAYELTDFLSADIIIANGEGYKRFQSDSVFRTGFGVTLTPINKLTGRVYYDFSSKETTLSSLATFVGYACENISFSAEYNQQMNNGFNEGRDLSGISFYTTYNASEKFKIFARYDNLTSNTLDGETSDWNLSRDGELFLVGIEYVPAKGVKIAPNFSGWNPADDSDEFSSTCILNCEFSF